MLTNHAFSQNSVFSIPVNLSHTRTYLSSPTAKNKKCYSYAPLKGHLPATLGMSPFFPPKSFERDVTVPSSATDITLPPPPGTGESITYPLGWILDNASGPIKYRSVTEIARASETTIREMAWLPYAHRPALRIAVTQSADGIWNSSMLTV